MMPQDHEQNTTNAEQGSGVRVIRIDDPAVQWEDYGDLPGDRTPGNPVGRHANVFRSADGRVTVGLWTRDADFGDLLGTGQCFDFVIEGDVTVTDDQGTEHHAGSGDLLMYSESDTGTWAQPGPIRKIFVHVRD
ncbi:cupin domain-containing protein [Streptomyces sp. NPDC058045]|uniref:cupin domain-containing protein n=1 Tax=Streptomyces sp. NPDC058045 TaxID=3346311 RepID=UPI0036F064F3